MMNSKLTFCAGVLAYGMAFAAFILFGPVHHGWLMAIGLFNYASDGLRACKEHELLLSAVLDEPVLQYIGELNL